MESLLLGSEDRTCISSARDYHAQLLRCLSEALLANPFNYPVPEDVPPVLGGELQVEVGLADAMVSSHQLH